MVAAVTAEPQRMWLTVGIYILSRFTFWDVHPRQRRWSMEKIRRAGRSNAEAGQQFPTLSRLASTASIQPTIVGHPLLDAFNYARRESICALCQASAHACQISCSSKPKRPIYRRLCIIKIGGHYELKLPPTGTDILQRRVLHLPRPWWAHARLY
jgi:hypothetical protein